MTNSSSILADVDRPSRRFGQALQATAFAVLLACAVGRCFLAEAPYRISALHMSGGSDTMTAPIDRAELARVTFAVLLCGCGALWALGGAIAGRLRIRHGWLAAMIAIFAVLSFVSATRCADQRAAVDSWIEQVSLLGAGFLIAQLCDSRRRFAVLVVVLASLGAALAVKGLWQVFVEAPERIVDFQMHQAERLRQFGLAPGDSKAMILEARLRAPAPFGYFALANVFASVLIVLGAAAAGLAVDKFVAAARLRGQDAARRVRGEIHLPTLSAILAAAAAAAIGAVLILTRSRGGIGAGAVAAAGAAVAIVFRRRLVRHWRKVVILVAVAAGLGAAGTIAFGLRNDRLPTRTMTFRWHYWTASGEIIRDRPIWGVGPGNFPAAYLQYRRAEAEESVKLPHNVAMHSLTQYGLGGGLCYLAILAAVLIGASRPGRNPADNLPSSPPGKSWRTWAVLAAVAVSPLLARAAFADWGGNALGLLFDAVAPMVVLAAMLTMFAWWGGGRWMNSDAPLLATRIALAAAAAGFVLHGMVSTGLWAPGTAMVFWIVVGALLARGPGRPRDLSVFRWPVAVAAALAVAAAVTLIYLPVSRRTHLMESALAARAAGNPRRAANLAVLAAMADSSDALAAADAARMHLANCPPTGPARAECLTQAGAGADLAIRRNGADYAWRRLAANIAWRRAAEPYWRNLALDRMSQAIALNPMDIRLRLDFAEMLCRADRPARCLGQLDEAERIDATRLADSLAKFTPAERSRIAILRIQAAASRERPSLP